MTDEAWPSPPQTRPRLFDRLLSAEIDAPSATVARLLRRAPGVSYVSSVGPDKLRRALTAAEWAVAEVKATYHEQPALARALGLRASAGRDLAAFAEDLGALRTPTVLLWRRWEGLAVTDPFLFHELLGAFRARVDAEGPAFAAVLVAGAQLVSATTAYPTGPDRHRGPTPRPLPDGPPAAAEPGRDGPGGRPGVRWTPEED